MNEISNKPNTIHSLELEIYHASRASQFHQNRGFNADVNDLAKISQFLLYYAVLHLENCIYRNAQSMLNLQAWSRGHEAAKIVGNCIRF